MFSYRAPYDAILFSNGTIELSFALFFCMAFRKLSGIIPCSVTEQYTPSYVLTLYKRLDTLVKILREDLF